MNLKPDQNKLLIFHEGRKRRLCVGVLSYNQEKDAFEFVYDEKYINSKKAIPIGQELSLFKNKHTSAKGKLFPSFQDRIPSEQNPAYEDYCRSQGISPDENNPIILLGTIGRRGPSSFVFEPVYRQEFSHLDMLKFRKHLNLSRHDLSEAFEFSEPTIERIETGKSRDPNTMKRMQIYLQFPEVALWQLNQSGSRIHSDVLRRLTAFFMKNLQRD